MEGLSDFNRHFVGLLTYLKKGGQISCKPLYCIVLYLFHPFFSYIVTLGQTASVV
jgi:hypothetical protein